MDETPRAETAATAAPATASAARIGAALLLCGAAAAIAALLLLQHHGEPRAVAAVSQACGAGPASGCDEVARSAWSRVAGFPVAAWGLALYLSVAILLFLALAGPAPLAGPLALVAAGALASALAVDLVLLGVQALSIRAFCGLCIATYVLGGLALAALLPARRAATAAGDAFAGPAGRLALAGWAASVVVTLGFVYAANTALTARAEKRQARLLGAPAGPAEAHAEPHADPQAVPAPVSASATEASAATGAATGASTGAAAGPQDAAYWRAQAQKLQATIDDPQKLEAYFSARAQAEYDAAKVEAIDLARGPLKGSPSAKVTVVEYSDFMCPFCRQLAGALSNFVPQAGGRLAVYFKNFPLDNACNPKLPRAVHPGSCTLALGAICAQNQGKLEAYHDRVFGSELTNPQPADVVRLAGEAGLNAAALSGCLDDPQTKAALQAEIAEGNRLAVHSTPTVFINGKKLPRLNDFVAVVDKEAQKKGSPPLGR